MEKLTVCLLGKQGAGKSASGNTLLGIQSFYSTASSQRVTKACSMSIATVDELKIKVIDTPGWCTDPQFETEMKPKIIEYINECMPHVFLLVLPIGRFTNEEIDTVLKIFKEFGDDVGKHTMVLFTRGDELEEKPIEDYMEELHEHLRSVIQICGGRFHVFNNRNKDQKQVSSLLKKLKVMVEKNEGKRYTEATYKKTEEPRNEAENLEPGKIKIAAENKKRDHSHVGSVDGKVRKENEKGESLYVREELIMLKKNLVELTKTSRENERNIQRLETELGKTNNTLQSLLHQEAHFKKELQKQHKTY